MIESTVIDLIVTLLGAAIIGLVTAVWRLWDSHNALKLHIAESYVKDDAITDIKKDIRELTGIMHEIAGKLGISVRGSRSD